MAKSFMPGWSILHKDKKLAYKKKDLNKTLINIKYKIGTLAKIVTKEILMTFLPK